MLEPSYTWEPAPHTADLAIAVSALEPTGLFYAALDGLLGTLEFDKSAPSGGVITEYHLHLSGCAIEPALVDFLNECIYVMEVEELVPISLHSLKYDGKTLDAVLRCRPVAANETKEIGHIKAATYSDLEVRQVEGRFQARIVFDT